MAVTRLPTDMFADERLAVVAFKVRILAVTMLPTAMFAEEILADAVLRVTMLAYDETFMVVE